MIALNGSVASPFLSRILFANRNRYRVHILPLVIDAGVNRIRRVLGVKPNSRSIISSRQASSFQKEGDGE